jgi:hypothetical protein
MAVMFLLNMELAYLTPPVGLNLFISSFRFNKPVTTVYRVVLPFVALLYVGLILLILFPKVSSFTVAGKIAELKAEAAKAGVSPREAWMLECVQMDKNNPRPCTAEDKAKWGIDGQKPQEEVVQPKVEEKPAEGDPAQKAKDQQDEDALLREMMGEGSATSSSATTGGGLDEEALLREMMGEGTSSSASTGGGEAPAPEATAAPAAVPSAEPTAAPTAEPSAAPATKPKKKKKKAK